MLLLNGLERTKTPVFTRVFSTSARLASQSSSQRRFRVDLRSKFASTREIRRFFWPAPPPRDSRPRSLPRPRAGIVGQGCPCRPHSRPVRGVPARPGSQACPGRFDARTGRLRSGQGSSIRLIDGPCGSGSIRNQPGHDDPVLIRIRVRSD